MRIRVGLDVTPELVGATGVARYSRELRLALSRRADCEVVAFAFGRRSHPVPDGVRHLPVPLRAVQAAWRTLGLPRAEQVCGAVDIVHSLDLVPPPTRRALVVTVHDMVTAELPGLHPGRSARMQAAQQAALGRAAAVCAVSQATAERVAGAGVQSARLHVTPNGLTPLPAGAPTPINGRYVLLVGTLEPRKGHELLLRAVARASVEELSIVFAGPPAGRAEAMRALAGELGLADRLTVLGYVEDDVLGALYRDATLVCLPSLGEGFGLPVLEALAAGAPVLASDLPAIREVAGDCALLVPAGDLDALAAGVRRLTGEPGLAARLAAAGRERARAFTWEATAEATVRAYRSALGEHDGPWRHTPALLGQ